MVLKSYVSIISVRENQNEHVNPENMSTLTKLLLLLPGATRCLAKYGKKWPRGGVKKQKQFVHVF